VKKIPQLKPADRRLVRGYAPLILAVAVFVTVTATVPTVAPQQNVALAGDVSGGTVDPGAVPGAVPDPAAAPVAPAPGVPGATPGAAPGTPAGGGGAPAAAGANVRNCKGPQVANDPYSPPCVKFAGSNGGATSRGVSDKEIVLTFMNPTDGSKSQNEQIAAAIGGFNSAIFPETYAQMIATYQNLVTYFNKHFQFYGRKLVLKVFDGQQDGQGTNQSSVNADALKVAGTHKAFAEINATNLPYAAALSHQRVVNFGNLYASDQFYRANAPYSWTYGADCTQMANDLAALAVKGLAKRPAKWAGAGVSKSGDRRFAVIAPDLPSYQQCASTLIDAMKSGGTPPSTVIAYPFVASRASSIAQNMTQRIINDKVTSLLCLCDPLSQLLISNNLANSNYLPEFFDAGIAGLETDVFGQQMNQKAWAHATTLNSQAQVVGKYGSTFGYFAAKSIDPKAFVVNEVDMIYLHLYQLALGIQLAGPNLTPETFARGLASYRGGQGPYGPMAWTVNGKSSFSAAHDFRLQWWDPTATSSYDAKKGAWQELPTWYRGATLPAGEPALFPNGTR
jgi:hypothetical protein